MDSVSPMPAPVCWIGNIILYPVLLFILGSLVLASLTVRAAAGLIHHL